MPQTPAGDKAKLLPRGTQVDGFVIEAPLGAGAMGQVYRAHDRLTGKRVAIKFVQIRLKDDWRFRDGLLQEIALTAAMEHPNIATYAGHGTWRDMPYLALEHVPGPSLAEVIEKHPLTERQCLRFIIQAAEGLDHAFERCQLIHRDVKPGNLLIDFRGHAIPTPDAVLKIIDFGLAKAKSMADIDEFSMEEDPTGAGSTIGGAVGLGTPYYLSPEQAAGQEVDFRSDLYSLGATLFHMLTQQVPFPADNANMAMIAHLNEPVPDPVTINGALHPATCALAMRCLAKEPRQRFLSYQQFVALAKGAMQGVRNKHRLEGRISISDALRRPSIASADEPQRKSSGAEALREATTRIQRRSGEAG